MIIGLLEGILTLWPKAQAVAEEMHRTGEWSDEEWTAWKAKSDAMMASPAWQPDPSED
jgi:hypothetical protein